MLLTRVNVATTIDVRTLRGIPLFREFEDSELGDIAKIVLTERLTKHQLVVREGDPGDTFYILLHGSVAVVHGAGDGKETILSILKEGDFFGEMTILDSSLRSASIRTLTDVEVGVIRRDDFLELLGKNPIIGRSLVIELSERLRNANALLATLASQDIRSRMASLLLNLSDNFGEKVESGLRISLRLTNQELANMIGTTRETVNRTLNKFWDEHLIDMRTSHIIVTDADALKALLP